MPGCEFGSSVRCVRKIGENVRVDVVSLCHPRKPFQNAWIPNMSRLLRNTQRWRSGRAMCGIMQMADRFFKFNGLFSQPPIPMVAAKNIAAFRCANALRRKILTSTRTNQPRYVNCFASNRWRTGLSLHLAVMRYGRGKGKLRLHMRSPSETRLDRKHAFVLACIH